MTKHVSGKQKDGIPSPREADLKDYAKVFRNAHAGVERWHVIRDHHLASPVESLSSHGPDICPYLIGPTTTERYAQHGWPFWALVCGTLAEVGGGQATIALEDLKEDTRAEKCAREYAEKARAGEWPPDSANGRVEGTQ